MACAPLPCLFPVSRVQRLRSLGRLGLVALFFFPGVGVVDDQVGQRELAGGLGGGDGDGDGGDGGDGATTKEELVCDYIKELYEQSSEMYDKKSV